MAGWTSPSPGYSGDTLSGEPGNDYLYGGAGDPDYNRYDDDTLYGGPGDDELHGGVGDDFLDGDGDGDGDGDRRRRPARRGAARPRRTRRR